jgi:hypothetical protein
MTHIPPNDGTALSPTRRTQLQHHTHTCPKAGHSFLPPVSRYQTCPMGSFGPGACNQSDNVTRCSPPASASASPSMQGWLARPPVPLAASFLPLSRPAHRERSKSQIGCQGWAWPPLRCGRSSDQGPRGAGGASMSTPHPCLHLKYPCCFPRHWPKRRPLAQQSLRLTPADLAGRANLDWLPPLGPHADMHERFAVTLGRPVSGQ